jgi:hypothetical protein
MYLEEKKMVNRQKCEGMGGKVLSDGSCKFELDDFKCKKLDGDFRDGSCELPKEKLDSIVKDVNAPISGNFRPKKG